MDRRRLVLLALAAGGENAIFSPVQVQKLLFLIDREASELVGGPHFNFEPYDYGPFDKGVYEELEQLSLEGMVKIQNSGRYQEYLLTPQGYKAGIEELEQLQEKITSFVIKAAEWVQKLSFQQLVAAIYKHYPEMKTNSVFRQ